MPSFFSQVLAAELTTGYETMANLQLFKVNGIPILNLKHLASVLDDITRPFSKDGDSHNSAAKTEITVTTAVLKLVLYLNRMKLLSKALRQTPGKMITLYL